MDTSRFFDSYYNNAEVNSILIMDTDGTVLEVNRAFTNNFGYSNDDIRGKHFSLLFTRQDQERRKPESELSSVITKGQSHDENYVINKAGKAVWCTGESMLVEGEGGEQYIVKDIINLQAKKQLQLFLRDTEELLERIFESSHEVPMMILDGSLKIQKLNAAFMTLFEIEETPEPGSRVADLEHPFWNNEDLRNELRQVLVNNEPLRSREFSIEKAARERKIRLSTKIIDSRIRVGRTLFVIVEEV